MSDFTDEIAGALAEAMDFTGLKTIAIGGISVTGDLDQLGEQSYTLEEGGKQWRVTAHFMAPMAQFNSAAAVPKAGRLVTFDGLRLNVISVTSDLAAASFRLGHLTEV